MWSLISSYFTPARSGRVKSWEVKINDQWYHQRSLVDDTNNEIISNLDTRKWSQQPEAGMIMGRVEERDGKRFLVIDGVVPPTIVP